MNVTRNGKIARLPHAVRQELNRRLHDGELGRRLVAWLNGLPEVRAVLAAEFGGRPVREQNLSEWRQGGHRDWLLQQDALEAARRLGEEAAELQAAGAPPLTDTLAVWVSARYAVATRQVAGCGGEAGWRRLREFCADLVELRRGDHGAARLKLEQERLRLQRGRGERRTGGGSEDRPRSAEEREQRIREVFGLPADPAAAAPPEAPAPGVPPGTSAAAGSPPAGPVG